jgi:cytochrome c553
MSQQSIRHFLALIALFASAVTCGAVSAADTGLTPPAGVAACKACHGPNGISISNIIPNLSGQKADYLAAQLTAFKSGDRKNNFMTVIAGQLSDADIHSFAQYWSSQPMPAPQGDKPPAATLPAIPSRMTLPPKFPAGYTLYQTIEDKDQGVITKRYANAPALLAARSGAELPDGSSILQVTYQGGKLQSYAGMESRAGWGDDIPALLKNGNWDYATFKASGERNDGLNQALCMACHKPAAADSYVFSIKELKAAASGKISG